MTNIKTSSLRLFNKIHKYIHNKRIHSTVSFENGMYVISLFELSDFETDLLISKMTAYLRLVPKSVHAA